MKKTDNITLWKTRFQEQKNSGLKVDEWCQQQGITKHNYYYWHAKISKLERKETNIISNDPKQEIIPAFAEIMIPRKTTSNISGGITVQWGELSIQITDATSIPLATEFLRQMEAKC